MKNCLIVRLSLELNADTVATHMQTQWPGYSWPAYVSLKEHQRCWQSLARYCRYSTSALHHISWSKAIMILKKWSPSSCTTFITYSLHLSNCTTLMRRQMPNLTQHIIDNQHLSSVELQFSDIHDCLIVVDHWIGMSCPSWQWHRTGWYSWSPLQTLQVAPLWCDSDLGCCSRAVVILKLRWNFAFTRSLVVPRDQDTHCISVQ